MSCRSRRQPDQRTTLLSLVHARVEERPGASAVVDGREALTYDNLERRSNAVAAQLGALGVTAGTLVAICMKRSAMLVTAALGVMKSGAAYVPLDPASPPARLAFMLRDSRALVVLTDASTQHRIPDGPWQPIQVSDEEDSRVAPSSPTAGIDPEQAAYVIYTSGSTGTPKGVVVRHRNLVNLVEWHCAAFDLDHDDRTTMLAGPGFDASVWEIWPTLAAGASLHVPDDEIRIDPERLRDWLVDTRITVAFVPTIMAERLMALAWPASVPLRLLLTGGEALRGYPPASLPFAVVNNYGPTESTVVATSGVVPAGGGPSLPTIGRPIFNVYARILDSQRRVVPDGTVGELYVGGAGVAAGYWGRPDLTAERFVPDPMAASSGACLYRTGDLAALLETGELAFHGRVDDQIELRGYRIEPNEIVAALDRHRSVAASAVVARDEEGERRLVAYVVPSGAEPCRHRRLRAHLEAALPAYMVPAVFVEIDALPLTLNGKLDRASLPAPDASNVLRDQALVAARTPLEMSLGAIVAGLLGLETVSVDDNLFMLGGHSLLGAQLVSRVRERFGVDLGLRAVFESPTVEGLAAAIERLVIERVARMDDGEVTNLVATADTAGAA